MKPPTLLPFKGKNYILPSPIGEGSGVRLYYYGKLL